MVKKSDFPKVLYVYLDEDLGETYMIARATERECDSLNETRLIGIYTLEKVGKLLPAEGVMVKC